MKIYFRELNRDIRQYSKRKDRGLVLRYRNDVIWKKKKKDIYNILSIVNENERVFRCNFIYREKMKNY